MNQKQNIQAESIARADNLMDAWVNPAMGMLFGITGQPLLGVAWMAAFGLYTYTRSEVTAKLDSFVEILKKGNFSEDDINNREFREGLNILFEAFMKARSDEKMMVIRRILLGFRSSNDKERFDLERLCLCTNSISFNGLCFLIFLKQEIIPQLLVQFKKDWYEENPNEELYWYKYVSISSSLSNYLDEQFDPSHPKACEKYKHDKNSNNPLQHEIALKMWRDQRYKKAELDDAISELSGMGILKNDVDDLNKRQICYLTEFGVEFMKYVFEEDFALENKNKH